MTTNLWGGPEGEMILFRSKTDVVEFVSKLGITCYDLLESFGIKVKQRQMTEAELEKHGLEFDSECPEDTMVYVNEKHEQPIYVIPMFSQNSLLTYEEQLSRRAKPFEDLINLKADEVELDDRYQFPCVAYIHLEEGGDRVGNYEIKLWFIQSLGDMNTVDTFKKIEDENAEQWNQNLETAIQRQREWRGMA